MKKQNTIIVMLGGAEEDKPRAARAKSSDEALVTKAAKAMGYVVGTAKTAKAQAIAKTLPEIKLFKTGRALVPRVGSELFHRLAMALTFPKEGQRSQPSSRLSATAIDEPGSLEGLIPNPWGELAIGSLVLAPDETSGGWYEAHVVGLDTGDRILRLQWRDWPNHKQFALPRTAVGLPPSARPTIPLIETSDNASEDTASVAGA